MKMSVNPHKLLAWVILGFLYALTTFRLLFIALPQWLRAPDTPTNVFAVIFSVLWIIVSAYLVIWWRGRKPVKKGIRRKC